MARYVFINDLEISLPRLQNVTLIRASGKDIKTICGMLRQKPRAVNLTERLWGILTTAFFANLMTNLQFLCFLL